MPKSQKDLNYWLGQVRLIEESRVKDAQKKIRKIYQSLLVDLGGFLGNYYTTYSDLNGLLPPSLLQEKIRYARFMEEVVKRVENITPSVRKIIFKTVEDVYSHCYKGMVKAVKNSSTIKELSKALKDVNVPPEVIKNAVDNPLSGLTLNDRLEKNRLGVIYDIKQQINIGLINGDRYDTLSKKIAERLDISYCKADNIVRTETHRVQESGFYDCAKDLAETVENIGFVYVSIWRTQKDERVRPNQRCYTSKGWKTYKKGKANHQKLEGVLVKVGDKFDLGNDIYTQAPGNSGDASNDCRCRCFLEYKLMTVDEYKLTLK